MIASLGYIAVYIVLIGVASFFEAPVARTFEPFQMNALIRAGSLAAASAALFAVDGIALPPLPWLLAALAVGLLTGFGSICYCVSLDCIPVSLVVTVANLYLVITVLLGMAVLHDPLTPFTIAGLVGTLVGMLLLVHPPAKYGVQSIPGATAQASFVRGASNMGMYVVLIGVGTFLEKPLLQGMDPTQLNALLAVTMTIVAGASLAITGPQIPRTGAPWKVLVSEQ